MSQELNNRAEALVDFLNQNIVNRSDLPHTQIDSLVVMVDVADTMNEVSAKNVGATILATNTTFDGLEEAITTTTGLMQMGAVWKALVNYAYMLGHGDIESLPQELIYNLVKSN